MEIKITLGNLMSKMIRSSGNPHFMLVDKNGGFICVCGYYNSPILDIFSECEVLGWGVKNLGLEADMLIRLNVVKDGIKKNAYIKEDYMANKYKGHKECYVCGHCGYDCPNANAQGYLDYYDIDWSDIAWNFEKIDCKDCYLHDYECSSCLFKETEECPEFKGKEN